MTHVWKCKRTYSVAIIENHPILDVFTDPTANKLTTPARGAGTSVFSATPADPCPTLR